MKKILLLILCFVALKSFGQDDTTKYQKYTNNYGLKLARVWGDVVNKIPDSARAEHGAGNLTHSGNKVYISDGTVWHLLGGGGVSSIDTLYSVIINADTIYSIQIRSDTINTVITNSDTIYSITIRTDSIFSHLIETDSVYSITSRVDTLIVNNNLVIPIRDTSDYADPSIGSITFAPSDNNYYGYSGTRWLCFSCSNNNTCYRDIIIDNTFFSDANTCTDASIVGTIYAIYWSDLPGYIYKGTDYTLNGNGFDINISNFDATAHIYNFHVYTIDTTGGCDNGVVINSGGGGSTYSFTTPLSESGGIVTIINGGADGTTKGAVTFTPSDFNSAAGLIALDYSNGQKATTSIPGFMTAAQATTLAATVPNTRTITAGIGLTGGGDLSANRTIALNSINGFIAAGTNVTVTGSGTIASPYTINSSGGGGGSTDTTSLSTRIDRLVLRFTIQTLTPANTVTMDLNSGYNATLLLNRATTVLAFSNISTADNGWIDVTQDGTGGRFITLPTGSVVANGFGGGTSITLSTGAGQRDRIYYSKNGSVITWTIAKNFQ